jgi:hypothetical protein
MDNSDDTFHQTTQVENTNSYIHINWFEESIGKYKYILYFKKSVLTS